MGISSPIMRDVFRLSENSSYNVRSSVTVNRGNIKTSKLRFGNVLVQSD